MPLNLKIENHELPDFRKILDRAMNTWEPRDQPPWLQEMSNAVDRMLTRLRYQEQMELETAQQAAAGH